MRTHRPTRTGQAHQRTHTLAHLPRLNHSVMRIQMRDQVLNILEYILTMLKAQPELSAGSAYAAILSPASGKLSILMIMGSATYTRRCHADPTLTGFGARDANVC